MVLLNKQAKDIYFIWAACDLDPRALPAFLVRSSACRCVCRDLCTPPTNVVDADAGEEEAAPVALSLTLAVFVDASRPVWLNHRLEAEAGALAFAGGKDDDVFRHAARSVLNPDSFVMVAGLKGMALREYSVPLLRVVRIAGLLLNVTFLIVVGRLCLSL